MGSELICVLKIIVLEKLRRALSLNGIRGSLLGIGLVRLGRLGKIGVDMVRMGILKAQRLIHFEWRKAE